MPFLSFFLQNKRVNLNKSTKKSPFYHLTRLPMPRSLARMLTASTASPKLGVKATPKPDNWTGVAQGLAAAKKAFQAQSLHKAEAILQEVLEFAPAEAKAWAWLGHIKQLQGHQSKAMQYFRKAKRLLATNANQEKQMPASLPLARLLWQQGEYESARAMLALLLQAKPDDEALLRLSKVWEGEQ